jgi:hypothetical protein
MRALLPFVRIPTKKIIHSELKTITSSPRDAVGNIVEEMIVMGQEGAWVTGSIISFPPILPPSPAQDLRGHAIERPFF